MAGFAGHAVLPSVHHDMEEPKEYNKMVNITYVIVTAVYALMASAGYAMFGSATMEEVRGFIICSCLQVYSVVFWDKLN